MGELPKVSASVRALNPDLFNDKNPFDKPQSCPIVHYSIPTKGDIQSHKELQHLAEMEISRRGVRQHLHLSDATRMKKVGWPDSTFVLQGIPVAIEYKIRPDKPTPDQVRTLNDMRADGWMVFVCYDFDQVFRALDFVMNQVAS